MKKNAFGCRKRVAQGVGHRIRIPHYLTADKITPRLYKSLAEREVALEWSSVDIRIVEAILSKKVKRKEVVGLIRSGARLITTKFNKKNVSGVCLNDGIRGDRCYVQVYGPWFLE